MSWFTIGSATQSSSLWGSVTSAVTSLFGGSHHEAMNSKSASVNSIVRELNAEDEVVASIRRVYEKQVIGTKLNIQSQTKNDIFNDSFENIIREWSKKGNCEISGRFYRGLMERKLVSEQEVLAGGFILRHHYSKRFKYGYKVELIPLSAIDRTKSNFITGLFSGIATNNFGEITGIWIYKDQTQNESMLVPYKNLTLSVAPLYDLTQYSGTSPVAPILATLDVLSEYTLEELKGAKTRAVNNLIVKTHFYAEIKRMAQEASGTALTPAQLKALYEQMKLSSNTDIYGAKYIPKEDEVVELGKNTQSVFEALDKTGKRGMSSAVGLSPMSMSGDMPSSYNASLYMAKVEEKTFEVALEDFVELAWREVFEVRLLNSLVLGDHINAPGYFIEPEKYRNLIFMRPSSDHIDPAKTQKGRTEGLDNKTMNPIDILASDGKDYKTQIAKEVAYEKERAEVFQKAGIPDPRMYEKKVKIVEKSEKDDDE